jgi:hypothetical protein
MYLRCLYTMKEVVNHNQLFLFRCYGARDVAEKALIARIDCVISRTSTASAVTSCCDSWARFTSRNL